MYESPIRLEFTDPIIEETKNKTDECIIRACQRVIPTIDRDELIKALAYDRAQYYKGFADGVAYKPPIKNNYGKIRAMSMEELANALYFMFVAYDFRNPQDILDWLRQEVQDE